MLLVPELCVYSTMEKDPFSAETAIHQAQFPFNYTFLQFSRILEIFACLFSLLKDLYYASQCS